MNKWLREFMCEHRFVVKPGQFIANGPPDFVCTKCGREEGLKNTSFTRNQRLTLILLWVAMFTLLAVGLAQAQDTSIRCTNKTGEVRYYGNYTCPRGWWPI